MHSNHHDQRFGNKPDPIPDLEFRQQTQLISDAKGAAARDYYSTVSAAGLDPFPVTIEKAKAGYDFLLKSGCSSAHPRHLAWVVALHEFPLDYQKAIGADKIPPAARGSARSLSPEPGKFATLELDIDRLKERATRPIEDECDEHEPKSVMSFKSAHTRALIIANRLDRVKYLDETVSLDRLLSIETLTVYIKLGYGVAPPKPDGPSNNSHCVPGGPPVLRFRLFNDLTAATMLASARFGPNSEQARFARENTSAQKHPQLSEEAVTTITALTQTSALVAIRDLDERLMVQAERETNQKTRFRLADVATAVAILKAMVPRPSEMAGMRIDGAGAPILQKRHPEIVGELTTPDSVRKTVLRRNRLRGIPEGKESWLFPGRSGPQLARSVSTSFRKTTAAAGFPGLTLQRTRDVCAKVMMMNDPGRFRLIAAVLGYSEVRTATRRYSAFRQPTKKAG